MRDVVADGNFLIDVDQTYFEISIEDLEFQFELTFIPGEAPNTVRLFKPGDKSLMFRMINFNQMLSTAFRSKVGAFNERELYIALFVTNLNTEEKQARLVNYTFSLGGPVGQ